jgi:hypothetical protein
MLEDAQIELIKKLNQSLINKMSRNYTKNQIETSKNFFDGLKRSSNYRGVRWCEKRKKWYSIVKYNGKSLHTGFFETDYEDCLAAEEAVDEIASW